MARAPQKPIRVLVASQYRLQRDAVRALIERSPGIRAVAEAADGREVLRVVGRRKVDVVLMDIVMPLLSGIATTARLSKLHPGVRVVLISAYENGGHSVDAIRAGAAGYVATNAGASELEHALREAAAGRSYLSPSSKSARAGAATFERLTPRQREVLQLIAEGSNTKEIASDLGISAKTVETHRAHLMEHLGIHDVAGLVRYAIRVGVATPEQ